VTFSIVALDPATGDLGVAVASRFLAAGAMVPSLRAGVGAVASQAWWNSTYGSRALQLLADGMDPASVIGALTLDDDQRAVRQLAVLDVTGRWAAWTGTSCVPWAGSRSAPGVSVQGNILAGPGVLDAMLDTWSVTSGPIAHRLLAALDAGDQAGGDLRGRQSAGLAVSSSRAGGLLPPDRWLDLRVDDHLEPIAELDRLLDRFELIFEAPVAADLVPLDDVLAAEIRACLEATGMMGVAAPPGLLDDSDPVPLPGIPRTLPATWDASLSLALELFLAYRNLDERRVAAGWIDTRVLGELRSGR
jgi:uncharacterized Ntn-hydrolase superfamily protein